MDRAAAFEADGRGFESLQARHISPTRHPLQNTKACPNSRCQISLTHGGARVLAIAHLRMAPDHHSDFTLDDESRVF